MKKDNSGKKKGSSEQEKLAEIEKLHMKDKEASLKGDFAILITLLTDDCALLPPDRPPIMGKDAISEYFDEQKELLREVEISEYKHDFQEIKIFGDWAYEWGNFSSTAKPANGGDFIKGKGKLFRILELQNDGSWKVARSIWNVDTAQDTEK